LLNNRSHEIQKNFSDDNDKKNKLLIEKFVDSYLKIPRSKLKNKWNNGIPLLSRILFSDFEKITKQKGKIIYLRLTSETYLLNAKASYLERIYKLSSFFSTPNKFINKLDNICYNSIHNSFHYEVLTFAKKVNLEDFHSKIEIRLNEIRRLY